MKAIRTIGDIEYLLPRIKNILERIYGDSLIDVILYGSFAKNNPTEDSDIDIAVVVDIPDHLKRIEITATLFHYASKVDATIEPKCIFWDEYQNHEKASILAEIIRTGIEVK